MAIGAGLKADFGSMAGRCRSSAKSAIVRVQTRSSSFRSATPCRLLRSCTCADWTQHQAHKHPWAVLCVDCKISFNSVDEARVVGLDCPPIHTYPNTCTERLYSTMRMYTPTRPIFGENQSRPPRHPSRRSDLHLRKQTDGLQAQNKKSTSGFTCPTGVICATSASPLPWTGKNISVVRLVMGDRPQSKPRSRPCLAQIQSRAMLALLAG